MKILTETEIKLIELENKLNAEKQKNAELEEAVLELAEIVGGMENG